MPSTNAMSSSESPGKTITIRLCPLGSIGKEPVDITRGNAAKHHRYPGNNVYEMDGMDGF